MKLDRLKFETTTEALIIYDKNLFDTKIQIDSSTGVENYRFKTLKLDIAKKLLGVNEITIKEHSGKVVVDLTGKILQKNYPEFIDYTNFSTAIKNLNNYGVAVFDEEKLWNAKPFIVHSTEDLHMKHEPTAYSDYLFSLCNSLLKGYDVRKYKNGVTIGKKSKSLPYIKLYGKHHELMCRKAANIQLLSYLTEQQVNEFKDVLRIEAELDSLKFIRDYTIETDVVDGEIVNGETVGGVLFSLRSPVKEILNKIIDETGIKTYEVA